MQIWAVVYVPNSVTEDTYQRALLLLDPESQTRIKRFYHRQDACRTLIGRFLVRVLLKDYGITNDAMSFSSTPAGKPYITTAELHPPIAYNITHDNALIAMTFGPGWCNPPAFSLGIDIMKVGIPGRQSFASFVDTFTDQLTLLEHKLLTSASSPDEALQRFFWMWTMKEAYTKALGMGLGFDFRRVQFDVEGNIVLVDGNIPKGWRFTKFQVNNELDLYQGVVAEDTGSDTEYEVTMCANADLVQWDAANFISSAISSLHENN